MSLMVHLFIVLAGDVPRVIVQESFWRDIWLITVSFVMFLGTLYVYFNLRASTFSRVRKLLEGRVEIKTKQLREKNFELEKLSLVASKTDNAVMVADAAGRIDWVNDAFIRMINNPHGIAVSMSNVTFPAITRSLI